MQAYCNIWNRLFYIYCLSSFLLVLVAVDMQAYHCIWDRLFYIYCSLSRIIGVYLASLQELRLQYHR